MQLGMIGLGRMGANMVRRLMRGGHQCVVYDRSPDSVKTLVGEGAHGTDSLKALVGALAKPRAVWIMVPAGAPTESTVDELAALLEPGDTILGLRLDHGGHLTHGLKVNFSGRLYTIASYRVSRETSLVEGGGGFRPAPGPLPGPFSPESSTGPLVGAAIASCSLSAPITGLSPTITSGRSMRARNARFSTSSRRWRMALRTASTVLSIESGFSMKSNAPSRVARMAVSTVPWPEIMMTGPSTRRSRRRSNVANPSMPGNQMASRMTS